MLLDLHIGSIAAAEQVDARATDQDVVAILSSPVAASRIEPVVRLEASITSSPARP